MCVKPKKNYFLFSFFLVAVNLLLSGCGQSETPTNENNSKPDVTENSEENSDFKRENYAVKKGNFIVEAKNATVTIETDFGVGSGFFIDSNCLILTSVHP